MAMWAANRIEEESVRQFDRGFERGRWLTDISVAKAIEDQDRARRVGLLVAGARQPSGSPTTRPPGQEPRPSLLCPPLAGGTRRSSTRSFVHADPQSASAARPPVRQCRRNHARRPGRHRHPGGAGRLAAPLTADWRRRLATRRFDAVYERNLLRRTGRG